MNKSTPNKSELTLTDHLLELRSRLIKVIVVLAIFVALLAPFMQEIFSFITRPMLHTLPSGNKLSITGVLEGVIVPFKVLLTTAFLLSLPFTLYQVWAFIAPGLYVKEKRIIFPLVFISLILFFLGMCFCYFAFFPMLFKIAAAFTPDDIAKYIPTIENYLSFILTMFIVFGLAFQLPIIMFVLNRFGIVSVAKMVSFRGYAIIAAFTIAAITTPPDVISQFFLAVPLVVLYEIGIIVCRLTAIKSPKSA